LHPRTSRRHSRRRHRLHASEPRSADLRAAPAVDESEHVCDPDLARVREAGGPIDLASYTCACGYLFRAAVSTSVACPHCGGEQAW